MAVGGFVGCVVEEEVGVVEEEVVGVDGQGEGDVCVDCFFFRVELP